MCSSDLQMSIGAIQSKRLTLRGTMLRSRPLEEKATLVQTFVQRIVPLLANGTVQPVVDRVFGFDEIAEAHAYMESNANFGKIVLEHEVR